MHPLAMLGKSTHPEKTQEYGKLDSFSSISPWAIGAGISDVLLEELQADLNHIHCGLEADEIPQMTFWRCSDVAGDARKRYHPARRL
jgi:hypothetical protein